MSAQIITLDDLYEFKTQLLEDIRTILNNQKDITTKKWLKSAEVRKLLNISPGTLQTLRINGTLPYTKIGGTMYYNLNDIEKLLNKNKQKVT
ncbi:MAG: helix-turn-helix domain-containing protein [Monoglobales bacterium]